MRISVVLVSYNTADHTLACLKRLRLSPVPSEIIVVDNASTDNSPALIASAFPEVRLIRLARNVGFGRAVNAGVGRATGDWVLLLNPDTEPAADALARLVAIADAHPERGIFTGRTLREDGTDDGRSCFGLPSLWGYFCLATGLSTLARGSRWLNPEELPGLDRSRPAVVPAVSGCVLLVRRDLFAALGGFAPEYFMYSEDIDLCTRAAALGARPTLVPEARVVHIGGASSTSVSKRVMVLRGKCTYVRLRWSRPRAGTARVLLATGIAVRAAASRLTGRADYWREVWAQRSTWLPGWPPPAQLPAVEVLTE